VVFDEDHIGSEGNCGGLRRRRGRNGEMHKLTVCICFLLGAGAAALVCLCLLPLLEPREQSKSLCWYFPRVLPVRVIYRPLGSQQKEVLTTFGRDIAARDWEADEPGAKRAIHVARVIVTGGMTYKDISAYLSGLPPTGAGSLTDVKLLGAPPEGSSLRYWLIPDEYPYDIEFSTDGRAILVVVAGYFQVAGLENASLLIERADSDESCLADAADGGQ
jgi:hypothetical protein